MEKAQAGDSESEPRGQEADVVRIRAAEPATSTPLSLVLRLVRDEVLMMRRRASEHRAIDSVCNGEPSGGQPSPE